MKMLSLVNVSLSTRVYLSVGISRINYNGRSHKYYKLSKIWGKKEQINFMIEKIFHLKEISEEVDGEL